MNLNKAYKRLKWINFFRWLNVRVIALDFFLQFSENYDRYNEIFNCWNDPYDKAYNRLWRPKFSDDSKNIMFLAVSSQYPEDYYR